MSDIYTEKQISKLEKYEDILDTMVDSLDNEYKTTKNPKVIRLLLETVATSTESIHKTASNKLKNDANKGNENLQQTVAAMLMQLADKENNPLYRLKPSEDIIDVYIEVPTDIVPGEDAIGIGYLSLDELKGSKKEVEDE